jgi:hypothetical protein
MSSWWQKPIFGRETKHGKRIEPGVDLCARTSTECQVRHRYPNPNAAHTKNRPSWSALKLSRKEKSLAAAGSCGAENRGREKPVAKMKRASQSGARTKKISVEKNRERKHHQIWDERYLKKRRDSKTEDLLTEKRKSMTRKAPGRNLVQSRASSDPAKLKREKEK